MEQITFNPSNEPYYSEDFIKGFKCGAERQFEADKKARQQGEWIEIWSEDGTSTSAYCGECHRVNQRPLGNFCKWCGADMREREGERWE